jgi:hypothetical protein
VKRFGVLLIALALIVGAGAVLFLPGYLEQREFLRNSKTYQDSANGFSFHFPQSWDLIPEKDLKGRNERFVVGVYRPDIPSTAVGVILEKRSPLAEFDEQSFVKSLEEELAKNLKNFQEISLRRLKRDGYPAVDIVYTYKHLDKAQVKQRQLIAVAESTVYYLSGTSLVDNYSRFEKDIDNIFNSFRLSKTP